MQGTSCELISTQAPGSKKSSTVACTPSSGLVLKELVATTAVHAGEVPAVPALLHRTRTSCRARCSLGTIISPYVGLAEACLTIVT